jgi:hypothetical protein
MKTRIIQTRFYEDTKVSGLSYEAQNLFMYFLTCPYINISGIFELSDRKIIFEHKCTEKQLEKAKDELERNKLVIFKDGWIFVVNAEKNNKYRNSPLNEQAYQRELERIPVNVKEYFDSSMDSSMDSSITNKKVNVEEGLDSSMDSSIDTTMDSSIYTNHNSKHITNNIEIINKKGVVRGNSMEILLEEDTMLELSKTLNIDQDIVQMEVEKMVDWLKAKGKRYKDYKAFARNWLRKIKAEDKPKAFVNENKTENYGW